MKLILKNLIRFIIVGTFSGLVYMGIEVLYRNYTHWTMMICSGLAVSIIGLFDEDKRKSLKIYQQCFIGMVIATLCELITGLTTRHFGLTIWDYSNEWMNYKSIICPLFSLVWFTITPLGIFIDNFIRYKFFKEEKKDGLFKIYVRLFTLK
jgi:uncharacterized membrane protein